VLILTLLLNEATRFDSLRRHKQEALAQSSKEANGDHLLYFFFFVEVITNAFNIEREKTETSSKIVRDTFHKMTAVERLELLSEAQANLEKLLQQEKEQIGSLSSLSFSLRKATLTRICSQHQDKTKQAINNRFGSLTTGHRPSYKEMKKQRTFT